MVKKFYQKKCINQQPPPPATNNNHGGLIQGVTSTLLQGFAFGTGSSLAREAVNKVFDRNDSHKDVTSKTNNESKHWNNKNCETDYSSFVECLHRNNNNSIECTDYFNTLQACQYRM